MGVKLVASRLPLGYSRWFRLGMFRHGCMGEEAYARRVFEFHRATAPAAMPADAVCLEIGPGDSLFTAVFAAQRGFARCILIDVGRFADDDLERFRTVAADAGLPAERIAQWRSLSAALEDLDADYLTQGLASLRTLPDNSVDFAFSHAVLEHVRKAEYGEFARELRRILKPGSITSHQVDLQDHLSGGLNNLRFPDRLWESRLFAESGFYTNRLSIAEHRAAFEDAGFAVEIREKVEFQALPIRIESMARQFRDRPQEHLMVHGFQIVATA